MSTSARARNLPKRPISPSAAREPLATRHSGDLPAHLALLFRRPIHRAFSLRAALAGSRKALLLVAATEDPVKRDIKAGDVIREIAMEVGGRGGGKPDLAQAGG